MYCKVLCCGGFTVSVIKSSNYIETGCHILLSFIAFFLVIRCYGAWFDLPLFYEVGQRN